MKQSSKNRVLFLISVAIFVLTACNPQIENHALQSSFTDDKLKVVATTTIVGDVVSQVGGDRIELSILLPVGTDPHGFDPTPHDIAKVAEADLVFANGAGLEEFLDNLIESAGAQDKVMPVSVGIDFLALEGDTDKHGHIEMNPHTWTDPNNVLVWVDNIENQLSELDPENADVYAANAQKYRAELNALDVWIRDQVARIPPESRKLVVDHALFDYFAQEYGFELVGALIPGYSTLSEPTAKELANIEDAIRQLGVKAVFVGNTVNPALAKRVAEDTGTSWVLIYTGSLSEPDGEASTYIEYMRYNINAFVKSLTP